MSPSSAARSVLRVLISTTLAVLLAFLCVELSPEPVPQRAARIAGFSPAADNSMGRQTREALSQKLAGDLGVADTTFGRLSGVLTGLPTLDFGESWRYRRPARRLVVSALGQSLILVGLSLVFAFALGLRSAVSAQTRGPRTRAALNLLSAALLSIPPVWLGILGLAAFAGGSPFRILPSGGASPAGMILPILVLSALPWAYVHRHAGSIFGELASQPWARAALARGSSRTQLFRVQITRTGLPLLLPSTVGLTGYLFGASAVIEVLFDLGGLGPLLLNVALAGDVPVLFTLCAVYALVVSGISVLSEIWRRRIDPRLREETHA